MSWFNQTVTYWAPDGNDSTGDATFATPAKLSTRWEQQTEQFQAGTGRSLRSRTVVYLQTDVLIGGYLFLGTSTAVDPRTLTDAFEIHEFRKIPNSTNTRFERRAMI